MHTQLPTLLYVKRHSQSTTLTRIITSAIATENIAWCDLPTLPLTIRGWLRGNSGGSLEFYICTIF